MAANNDHEDQDGRERETEPNKKALQFLVRISNAHTIEKKYYHFKKMHEGIVPIGLSSTHAAIMAKVGDFAYELSVVEYFNKDLSTAFDDYGKKQHVSPWRSYPEHFRDFICASISNQQICIFEKFRFIRMDVSNDNWKMLQTMVTVEKEVEGKVYRPTYESVITCVHNDVLLACITNNRRMYYKFHTEKEFHLVDFIDMEDGQPTSVSVSEKNDEDWNKYVAVGFRGGTVRYYKVESTLVKLDRMFTGKGKPYSLNLFKPTLVYTQNTTSLFLYHYGEPCFCVEDNLDQIPFWADFLGDSKNGFAAVYHDRTHGVRGFISTKEKKRRFVITNDVVLEWSTPVHPLQSGFIYPSVRVLDSCLYLLLPNGCLIKIS